MSFKTILTVVGVEQTDSDIKQALALCAENDAHLAVLVLALAAPPPVGEFAATVSDVWAQERDEDIARLGKRVDAMTKLLAASQVSADVSPAYAERAFADDAVGRRARYADLVFAGAELCAARDLKRLVLDGALFAAQRPVLMAPAARPASLTPKRVVIAWDESLEASRAVHEAIGLIAGAQDVRVTMVDPEADASGAGDEPGADLAAYLARHGAPVTIDRLPSSGRTVAGTLRMHAGDLDADMMVMGAYGHSRLRERILGGVTQSMTDEPDRPILIAR